MSYPTFVPNLIILSLVVAKKSSTEDVHMHYIGVRDGKIENLKKKEKLLMFMKHYAPNRCLCIKVAKSTMCN